MNYKDGLSNHRLYGVWNAMMQRCYRDNFKAYQYYGGRGIKVCERWHVLKNFIEDMFPSFKEGLQLDRINNNGNYEPANCRWLSRSANNKNTRTSHINTSDVDYLTYRTREDKWIYSRPFKSKEEAELFSKHFNEYVENHG